MRPRRYFYIALPLICGIIAAQDTNADCDSILHYAAREELYNLTKLDVAKWATEEICNESSKIRDRGGSLSSHIDAILPTKGGPIPFKGGFDIDQIDDLNYQKKFCSENKDYFGNRSTYVSQSSVIPIRLAPKLSSDFLRELLAHACFLV